MESGTSIQHGPKIAAFDCAAGRVAIAFAGNVTSAVSTIQKCGKLVRKLDAHQDIVAELESVLDGQYRRLVFGHPHYGKDGEFDLHFGLLVSVWLKADGKTYLFASDETKLNSVYAKYHCLGIGKDLGDYIAGPLLYDADPPVREESALILAAFMLARVKDTVPGTGGVAQFYSMRHTGEATPNVNMIVDEIQKVSRGYEVESRKLLFSMAGDDESELEDRLKGFGVLARNLMRVWRIMKAANPTAQ